MSKRNGFVGFVFICLLFSACCTHIDTITPTITATENQVLTAAQTPGPTETVLPIPNFMPIIIPTSAPPSVVMPFSGIYSPGNEGNLLVMFYGPQGTFEEIVLPNDGYIDWVGNALSPDQEWVVFKSGTIENNDIDLNLLNLNDQSVIHLADLLSENFPEDISEIADQIVYVDPEDTETWDHAEAVLHSLKYFLGDYAWSPDGRYLAFVGQMDGPSTDVYLYEMATGEVERLTTDIYLKAEPQWSPDSETVIYTQNRPTKNRMELDSLFYVGILDQEVSTEIKGYAFVGWLSDSEFLLEWGGDGITAGGLSVVDLQTGQLRLLWTDYWPGYKFSYEDHTILLHSSFEGIVEGGDKLYGVFLVNPDGSWEEVMQVEYLVGIMAWSTNVSDYLIHYLGTTLLYSREDGLRELYSDDYVVYTMFFISPDQRWMLVKNSEDAWVYDSNAQVALEFSHQGMFNFIRWGPNSDGFFYWDDGWLYYMALPSGEVLTMEPCERDGCWIYEKGLVWFED